MFQVMSANKSSKELAVRYARVALVAAALCMITSCAGIGHGAPVQMDFRGPLAPALGAPVGAVEAPKVYASALDKVVAEQAGPVAVTPDAVTASAIVRANASPLRPAQAQAAVLRSWNTPSVGGVGLPGASPNLFGSTALPIGRTPLDAKWQAVNHTAASPAAAGEILSTVRGEAASEQLQRVNAWVNRHIAFTADARAGAPDHWAGAEESLRKGAGDCEDYAIAKMQILRAAGFAERDLYLVLVKDLVRRADHALLVVRVDGRFVVLDSNTDRIVSADAVQDYKPLMTFSGDRAWIHGYRQDPNILLASNETAAAAADPTLQAAGF
jgi:predicted transglutaminase-like cysteine proteinase